MPRNGSGVYSLPGGTTIANGDTSDASDLNTPLTDIETDMNTVRPVVAGGTGSSTAAAAATALGLGTGSSVEFADLKVNTSSFSASEKLRVNGRVYVDNDVTVAGGNLAVGNGASLSLSNLDVLANAAGTIGGHVTIRNEGAGTNTAARLTLAPNTGGGSDLDRSAFVQSVQTSPGGYASLQFGTANSNSPTTRLVIDAVGHTRPNSDNAYELGTASYRWKEFFCANGTINTSDGALKANKAAVSKAEAAAAWGLAKAVKTFKWKDAVASKGRAAARKHTGLVAQEIEGIFSAQGLDATRYGILCKNKTAAGDDIYGLRYSEAHSMIVAALVKKIEDLESRLGVVEKKE